MRNIKIINVVIYFGMLFAQEELPNSSGENVSVENYQVLDSLQVETDSLSVENYQVLDSLQVENDSISVENYQVLDSLKVDNITLENDSTGIEIIELNEFENKFNELKTYLKGPNVKKILIGAGIVVPIIYMLSRSDDDNVEKVGSPPKWPE
jgi:hypothetical protein